MSKFFLTLQLGGYLLGWFQRAKLDGKITSTEVLELVTGGVGLYEDATGEHIEVEGR